jgi:hypothetical protein
MPVCPLHWSIDSGDADDTIPSGDDSLLPRHGAVAHDDPCAGSAIVDEAARDVFGDRAGSRSALRSTPEVGYIEMNRRRVSVRWARQQPKDGGGRTISVVADEPLYFVGGGSVDAKPRSGYELTIVLLDVDTIGLGTGSLAAAARVKPGGPTGVEVDDYAQKPIQLLTVRKAY